MSSQLIPFECLEQVFINLLYNKSTLFNCLLVNRSWCRQVVPLLWSRPFHRLQWNPSSHLIQTYVSCMTTEEKSFLTRLEIPLPESVPLFSYAKYLKEFNYQELSNYVHTWYCIRRQHKENECEHEDYIKIDLITKELGNFLISHSNLISELYISKISKVSCFSQTMDVTSFLGATNSLSHLRRVRITGAREMEIKDLKNLSKVLNGLSKICTSIRELEVYKFYEANYDLMESLIALIKAQQNLSKFVASCWNLNLDPLISALRTQIDSLTEIEFTNTKFDNLNIFDLLVSCPRLRIISLQQCDGLFSRNVGPKINFPVGLKKLYLCDNDISSDTLIALLHNTNSSLSRLTLDAVTSMNVIETIATRCPNLSYLDIKVLNADVSSLLRPLRRTQLKHLVLNNISSKGFYDDEKFPEIGKFLPKTLQNLALIYWDFTLKSLQSFLENCDFPLKKLFLHRDNGLNDDHLDVITRYARGKGTLKSLNFLFRPCGNNSSIPSQEAVKKAQEVIPMVQGKG